MIRTKCRSCHIIADDIGRLSKILRKGTKLVDYLEESFCNDLGSNHQPYRWLEATCDEMIEEKIGEPRSFHTFIHSYTCATFICM